jgi:hypothetical protein
MVETAELPGEIEPEGEVAVTVYADAAAAFTVTLTTVVGAGVMPLAVPVTVIA